MGEWPYRGVTLMRWLILLLVVINVIYFIWASNNPPSDIARASVELTGANLGAEGQSLNFAIAIDEFCR